MNFVLHTSSTLNLSCKECMPRERPIEPDHRNIVLLDQGRHLVPRGKFPVLQAGLRAFSTLSKMTEPVAYDTAWNGALFMQ